MYFCTGVFRTCRGFGTILNKKGYYLFWKWDESPDLTIFGVVHCQVSKMQYAEVGAEASHEWCTKNLKEQR